MKYDAIRSNCCQSLAARSQTGKQINRCFVAFEGKEVTVVPMLEYGELISYTIPSFPFYQSSVPDKAGAPTVKIVERKMPL